MQFLKEKQGDYTVMSKYNPRGRSYEKRVREINRIYDEHSRSGLSNREIWRRYIYPVFGISERTFYKALKDSSKFPPAVEQ